MATEIEIKAWVDHRDELEARLRSMAIFIGPYRKQDVYFTYDRPQPGQEGATAFRIREDGGRFIVTNKVKTIRDGVEVSLENEFTVSDAGEFERMMVALGFHSYIRKEKIGTAWKLGAINVDFSLVTGLGDFIELEILLENGAGEPAITRAKEALLAALSELGLSAERMEALPYTELLARRGHS